MSRASSSLVALGILLSRIAGLVRNSVLARYLGLTPGADALAAGMRLPNVLQNLLGEGTLSASFIPVYAELLEEGREEEAGRVAGAIFSLLLVLAAGLALLGVLGAPLLVSVFLAGFAGDKRDLTISVVRIIFPTTGILVLSAWALGILNSHRRFFLSYVAPVASSAAIIATLLLFGRSLSLDGLVIAAAWGALAGALLQFVVQLPTVLRLARGLRLGWSARPPGAVEAVRNAGPAVLARGVVQISGWIDGFLASFLFSGAFAALWNAQTLYQLPVSLFGMSVAAAELPELARQRGAPADGLASRASAGLQRIAFYVVPSVVAFVLLGDVMVAALFQGGQFGAAQTRLVHAVLAAMAIGLIPSTATQLLKNTFFALRDTRTPARYAAIRVALAAVLALLLMVQFEPIAALGIPAGAFGGMRVAGLPMGAVGLAAGSGIAAWVEWALLRRALRARVGPVGAGAGPLARMLLAALAGAAAGWGVRLLVAGLHPIVAAVPILFTFGLVYFGVAAALGLEEIRGVGRRVRGLIGR